MGWGSRHGLVSEAVAQKHELKKKKKHVQMMINNG